jgi:hypothetical protein
MDILEYTANIDNKDFLQEKEEAGNVEVKPPPHPIPKVSP